jgi:hypothetical protein
MVDESKFHKRQAMKRGDIVIVKKKSLYVVKALPKQDKTEQAKKTPSKKVASKQQGDGGKTRYNYPQDKKPGAQQAKPAGQDKPPAVQDPIQVPKDSTPKTIDPNEFAAQLQIPLDTLKRIAERFAANKKLGGRKGFTAFMCTRLKAVVDKHHLDGDFFNLLYQQLITPKNPPPSK